MKRVSAIACLILLLLTSSFRAGAQEKRFHYGAEWGYSATFLRAWQYNYISSESYRVIDEGAGMCYFSNGTFYVNAGYDFCSKACISLYTGFAGVYSKRRVIPLELRLRYCPSGLREGGFICHAALGTVFPTGGMYGLCARGALGAGVRVPVFRTISVDFLASLQATLDRDRIKDPDTGADVPARYIRSNAAEYLALNFSVAVNF